MQSRKRWSTALFATALSVALGGFALSAAARPAVVVPEQVASMAAAVQVGKTLFQNETFSGERTCRSCHQPGGVGPNLAHAAANFPRFVARLGRVQTLEEQIVHCITAGNKGEAPALGSVALDDLTAYVTSLAKGQTIGAQFGGK